MTKTAKSQCHLPISLTPNPPMDIHGRFVIGEIKKAILNVSKSKPNEGCSTSFGVPVESSSHYINELDLILVTDESLLKASFGNDGVIRVLLCEFLFILQNYKQARFLSKKTKGHV